MQAQVPQKIGLLQPDILAAITPSIEARADRLIQDGEESSWMVAVGRAALEQQAAH